MLKLIIRINQNNITFIDLYKEGSTLPLYSAICITQSDINTALRSVSLLSNNLYTTELVKI